MKALVIDDTKICLDRTVEVLRKEGWETEAIHITDDNRESFQITELNQKLPFGLKGIDLVVSDLEFGGNVNAFGLVCAIRNQFSRVPVVLLTGARIAEAKDLSSIGIYYFDKGRWFNRKIYPKAGNRVLEDLVGGWDGNRVMLPKDNPIIPADDPAWQDKYWILDTDPRLKTKLPQIWSELKAADNGNIESVFNLLKSWVKKTNEESKEHALRDLEAIAKLSDESVNMVPRKGYDGKTYYFEIRDEGPLTHQIGHALCDGNLSPADVAPYLPALRKVLNRIKDYIETDERFRPCADFILSERPSEDLDMILKTY